MNINFFSSKPYITESLLQEIFDKKELGNTNEVYRYFSDLYPKYISGNFNFNPIFETFIFLRNIKGLGSFRTKYINSSTIVKYHIYDNTIRFISDGYTISCSNYYNYSHNNKFIEFESNHESSTARSGMRVLLLALINILTDLYTASLPTE